MRNLLNALFGREPEYEIDQHGGARSLLVVEEQLTPEEKVRRDRLEEKRKAAIAYLGKKWIMHEDHVQHGPSPDRVPRVLDQAEK